VHFLKESTMKLRTIGARPTFRPGAPTRETPKAVQGSQSVMTGEEIKCGGTFVSNGSPQGGGGAGLVQAEKRQFGCSTAMASPSAFAANGSGLDVATATKQLQ
jgi:hypothetical protein